MKMEFVECSPQYWDFIRKLRNDKRVQDGFVETGKITAEQQIEYMKVNSTNYRVALINGSPAGYIGVLQDDIRVCTHPEYQGKGVGRFMVEKSLEIWPNAVAKVKVNNIKSVKLFEACGFKKKYFIFTKE